MAGEGSMMHMITTLRNNKYLLRRKRMFKKERTFLSVKKEYYKATKGEINIRKLSKEELLAIRNSVIKSRRSQRFKTLLITSLVLGSIFILVFRFSSKLKKERLEQVKIIEARVFQENLTQNTTQYNYFIKEGDLWVTKGNWDNAVFEYKIALKIFPHKHEINYKLALAYVYNCSNFNQDCDKGKKLLDSLLLESPNNVDLLELKYILEE